MAKRKTVPHRRTRPGRSAVATKALPAWRYIESSAVVAALIEGDRAAKASIRAPGRITSALTIAESSRAVLRAHLSGRITAQQHRAALLTLQRFARRCYIVHVTETILTRAGHPFPVEPMRTLDAIHLATAEALGEPPALEVIITRDIRVRENATALGFSVE